LAAVSEAQSVLAWLLGAGYIMVMTACGREPSSPQRVRNQRERETGRGQRQDILKDLPPSDLLLPGDPTS
jgi:hypothetical protein